MLKAQLSKRVSAFVKGISRKLTTVAFIVSKKFGMSINSYGHAFYAREKVRMDSCIWLVLLALCSVKFLVQNTTLRSVCFAQQNLKLFWLKLNKRSKSVLVFLLVPMIIRQWLKLQLPIIKSLWLLVDTVNWITLVTLQEFTVSLVTKTVAMIVNKDFFKVERFLVRM